MTGTNNAPAGQTQDSFLDDALGILDAAQQGVAVSELAGVVASAEGNDAAPNGTSQGAFSDPDMEGSLDSDIFGPIVINSGSENNSSLEFDDDISLELKEALLSGEEKPVLVDDSDVDWAGVTSDSSDFESTFGDSAPVLKNDTSEELTSSGRDGFLGFDGTLSDDDFLSDVVDDGIMDFSNDGEELGDTSNAENKSVAPSGPVMDEDLGDDFSDDDFLSDGTSGEGDDNESLAVANTDNLTGEDLNINADFLDDVLVSRPVSNPSENTSQDAEDDFLSSLGIQDEPTPAPIVTTSGNLDDLLSGKVSDGNDDWGDDTNKIDPISDWVDSADNVGGAADNDKTEEERAIIDWSKSPSVDDGLDSIIGDQEDIYRDLNNSSALDDFDGHDEDTVPVGVHGNADDFAAQLASMPIGESNKDDLVTMEKRATEVPEFAVEEQPFERNGGRGEPLPVSGKQTNLSLDDHPVSKIHRLGWPVALVALSLSCALSLFTVFPDISPFKQKEDPVMLAKLSALENELLRLREDISVNQGVSQRVSDFSTQLNTAKGQLNELTTKQQSLFDDLSRVGGQMANLEQDFVSRMGIVVNLVGQLTHQQAEQSQSIKDTVLREALSIMENQDAPSSERIAGLEKLTLEMQRRQEKLEAVSSSQRQVTSFLEADVEYLKKQSKVLTNASSKQSQNFEQKIMTQPLPTKKSEASVVVTPTEQKVKATKTAAISQEWHVVGAHAKANGEYDIYLQPANDSSPAAIKTFSFGSNDSSVIPEYGKILGVRRIDNTDMIVPYVVSTERGEIRGRR